MALTEGKVLSFLLDHGGKVKNAELLSNFKEFVNGSDPLEKGRNRDLFKSFVNTVAVVKRIDDEKYVVVKKKYKELVKGERNPLEAKIKPNSTSLNSSPASSGTSEQSGCSTCESYTMHNADVLNNNSNFCSSSNSVYHINSERLPAKLEFQVNSSADPVVPPLNTTPRSRQEDLLTILHISNNTRVANGGAVFAVLAIKSPSSPHLQLEHPCRNGVKSQRKALTEDSLPRQMLSYDTLPMQVLFDRTVAAGNGSSYLSNVTDGHDLYGSPRTKRRQSVAPGSQSLKTVNKVTRPALDASFPLDPREHEWLLKSAAGHWDQIYQLLLQDIKLAEKRDFMSGFTALHWAAKKGNSNLLHKILLLSQQSGAGVDVNAKSHDGYTPLHIASIHNHESVLSVLVHDCGANYNIRDNSGYKPYHYLHKDASPKVREMLGDPRALHWPGEYKGSDHDEHFPGPPKGFSTLSKFFQSRQRKKLQCRPSFRLVSLDQDEDRRDYTFSSRMFYCN